MSESGFKFRGKKVSILWIKFNTLIHYFENAYFPLFRALGSTYSPLHHRLPKSFNADAISPYMFWNWYGKDILDP